MSNNLSLSEALFTRTQARVLGLLFAQPDRSFYLAEIMRAANVGRGGVQRELERLVKSGLVTVRSIGNQRHYEANPRSPIFNELQGIVLKTSGIADVLRDALASLGESVTHAFVFGSIAGGTAKAGSDIDLLVIGDVSFANVVQALMDIHDKLGREVNPVVMTMDDFMRKMAMRDRFVSRIGKEPKIHVKGDHDELEKSVEDWPAD
ncbi:MAG TPA: nucleotidyltransferase domain-containing protein [Gammaproteobacteria bacterium]